MKYNKILIYTSDIWSVPSPLKPKGQAFLRNSFHEVTKMSLIEIIFPENVSRSIKLWWHRTDSI